MFNFQFKSNSLGGRVLGLAGLYLLFSVFFGAIVWIISFLVIVKQFSWLSIFFIFLIKAVPFVAASILLVNHQWIGFVLIVIGLFSEYIMRFYIARLTSRKTRRQDADSDAINVNSSDIIDV